MNSKSSKVEKTNSENSTPSKTPKTDLWDRIGFDFSDSLREDILGPSKEDHSELTSENPSLNLFVPVNTSLVETFLDEVRTWNDGENASEVFTDIPGKKFEWAVKEIDSLANDGILEGYGDGTFGPEDPTTIHGFLLMMFRMDGGNVEDQEVVQEATTIGAIDKGVDPNREITRGEAARVICKIRNYPAWTGNFEFTDSAEDDNGKYLEALRERGIFVGYEDGTVKPSQTLIRAEAAVLVFKGQGTSPEADSISAYGAAYIATKEGFVATPYNDAATPPNATIGYGHKIHDGPVTPEDEAEWGTLTKEEGLKLLLDDLQRFNDAVFEHFGNTLNQGQFDAMTSFVFNGGTGWLTDENGQDLVQAILNGEHEQAMEWFEMYVNGGNGPLAGLITRRAEERSIYEDGYTDETINKLDPTALLFFQEALG